jgi:hypothetical protein
MTIILGITVCAVCIFAALAIHSARKIDCSMKRMARERLLSLNDKSNDIATLASRMGIEKEVTDIVIAKIRWLCGINDFPIYLEDIIEDIYYIDAEGLEDIIKDMKEELRISDDNSTQDGANTIITISDLLNYVNNLRNKQREALRDNET